MVYNTYLLIHPFLPDILNLLRNIFDPLWAFIWSVIIGALTVIWKVFDFFVKIPFIGILVVLGGSFFIVPIVAKLDVIASASWLTIYIKPICELLTDSECALFLIVCIQIFAFKMVSK